MTATRTLSVLRSLLRIAEDELERGCPNLDDKDVDALIDSMSTIFGKEKPMTAYKVCRKLGIVRSTLYEWIKKGKIPKGFQLEGDGNRSYWYLSDIKKAQAK